MEQKDRNARIRKAEGIYESKLRNKLEPLHTGQYIAIDPETEDYFLGNSLREACLSVANKHPKHKLVCLRVGYPATRLVGSHT